MRRFTSYGPPDPEIEFMVQRQELVQQIAAQLVGRPGKGGHYFTVFAPRQSGKTTTLRQVEALLTRTVGDQFHVVFGTLHLVTSFRDALTSLLQRRLGGTLEVPATWAAAQNLLMKGGPLSKPLLLVLDEFDALPPGELEDTITLFRQLYLERQDSLLHGVALIGVHAVLGNVERSASPFNVQRSVHIPNLTQGEVEELFKQYQAESGQRVEPEVVERLWDLVRGQPGLTGWFGELLTEKYNPAQPPPWRRPATPTEGYPALRLADMERVIEAALSGELNTNIRNLLSKSNQHRPFLRRLFVEHDIKFKLYEPEQQWLHLNGVIIGVQSSVEARGMVCAFASPFVQRCLFQAFGEGLAQELGKAELFAESEGPVLGQYRETLDVGGLLTLYRSYLLRQAAKGEAPWAEQPVRSDARAFEAIGHFNLYAWLSHVLKGYVLTPEFPTGNGTADLVLRRRRTPQTAVLELKSFTEQREVKEGVEQVARYARKLGLSEAWLVMMADTSGYDWLTRQPATWEEGTITVHLELIPWGWVKGGNEEPSAQKGMQVKPEFIPRPAAAQQTLPVPPSPPPARLGVRDRLGLETLVVPLLIQTDVATLWERLGMHVPEQVPGETSRAWRQLLLMCEEGARLADLLLLLVLTFPELESHPLLVKLQKVFPPVE